MGSPDVGTEARAWLEDDDRKKAEEAIRSVRKRLTRAFDPKEDMGVLESQRPRHIARLLAGHLDEGVDLFELMWAREHFVELGQKIVPFYNDFVKARVAAKRGKKLYVSTERELRAAFGDDWKVVEDAWPAVLFLVQVLALREDLSVPEEERAAREEAHWDDADVFLTLLNPNQPIAPDLRAFAERLVSRMKRVGDVLVVQEVFNYLFDDDNGLQKRLLAYQPTTEQRGAWYSWIAAIKNAARDARARTQGPTPIGKVEGVEVKRARGTLRRWHFEDRQREQVGESSVPRRLVDRALENDARMRHFDPTGSSTTLTQFARKHGVSESGARNALKRAISAGALLPPQRLPGSTSYALRPADEKILLAFLGSPRSRKGEDKRTLRAVARQAGVPVQAAIEYLEQFHDDTERVVSAKTTLTVDVYEILVDALRQHFQIAATSGSAKPRTS